MRLYSIWKVIYDIWLVYMTAIAEICEVDCSHLFLKLIYLSENLMNSLFLTRKDCFIKHIIFTCKKMMRALSNVEITMWDWDMYVYMKEKRTLRIKMTCDKFVKWKDAVMFIIT